MFTQGGPLPVINGVITSISRVITYNPSFLFIRQFIANITPFVTGFWGPPCI